MWRTCLILTLLRAASGTPTVFDIEDSPEAYKGFYPTSYYRGLDEPPVVTPPEEWEEPAVTSSAPAQSTPTPGTPPPDPAESAMTPGTITGIVFAALFVAGVVGIMAVSFARPEWVKCFTRVTPHGMP